MSDGGFESVQHISCEIPDVADDKSLQRFHGNDCQCNISVSTEKLLTFHDFERFYEMSMIEDLHEPKNDT